MNNNPTCVHVACPCSTIVDLDTRWKWSASLPGRFILGKVAVPYPLGKGPRGPHSRSGVWGEKVNLDHAELNYLVAPTVSNLWTNQPIKTNFGLVIPEAVENRMLPCCEIWRRVVCMWTDVTPKRRFAYRLHGAISQKTTTFITTAVRTSNRT
jgi:hypothetical protein